MKRFRLIPSLLLLLPLSISGALASETKGTNSTPTVGIPAAPMHPGRPVTPAAQATAQPAVRATPTVPMRVNPAGTGGAAKLAQATLIPGVAAPDFVSQDLADKEVRLSGLRNKVVVLDFWATWCGPCKASLPHTQQVAKQYKDQGVVVLAVCTSDTRAKFEAFVKANQKKYPDIVFTCDPHDRNSETFDERASRQHYGVRGIPTQFVIGPDGKIAAVLVGYETGETRLEDALAKLGLKAEPVPTSRSGH